MWLAQPINIDANWMKLRFIMKFAEYASNQMDSYSESFAIEFQDINNNKNENIKWKILLSKWDFFMQLISLSIDHSHHFLSLL